MKTDLSYADSSLSSMAVIARYFDQSFYRQAAVPTLRFVYTTAADQLATLTLTGVATTAPVELKEPSHPAPAEADSTTPATMIAQLLNWLEVTYDQLADMTGVSRSALFYWRKTGATPRTSNMRQVLRLYSLVSLIVRRFGSTGSRRWLQGDGHPVLDFLRKGDLDQAEHELRLRLFGQVSHPTRGNRAIPDEVVLPLGASYQTPLKRANRIPKKGRLSHP